MSLQGKARNTGCRFVCGISVTVRTLLRYLIFVALLINGDNEFGNVSDELIAFGFPQCLHTDFEVFHQDFLKRGRKGIRELHRQQISTYTVSTNEILHDGIRAGYHFLRFSVLVPTQVTVQNTNTTVFLLLW